MAGHFILSRFGKTRAGFRVAGHISPILNEFGEDIERWYKWGPARSKLSVRSFAFEFNPVPNVLSALLLFSLGEVVVVVILLLLRKRRLD